MMLIQTPVHQHCPFFFQSLARDANGHLLAAVLEALCDSTVKLTKVLPILREHPDPHPPDQTRAPVNPVNPVPFAKQLSMEDSPSAAQAEARAQFPELVVHMEDRVQVSFIPTSSQYRVKGRGLGFGG